MGSQTAVVVLAAVAVTVVCLWLLLRRGSMAHRAERDFPDDPGSTERTGP